MQVVFDFANQRINVDGEGQELVQLFSLLKEIAPQIPSITFSSSSSGAKGAGTNNDQGGNGNSGNGGSDIKQTMRQFVRSLSLGSMSEKICAIAYYQKTVLSRSSFSPKEMGDWFVQCGLEKPAQMPVAVFDAKKKNGYLDNAGHGSWKLDTQGENMIIRKIEEAGEQRS